MLMVMADGARWRRARDPAFDTTTGLALLTDIVDIAPLMLRSHYDRNADGATERRANNR
jgi:hypothetical protein